MDFLFVVLALKGVFIRVAKGRSQSFLKSVIVWRIARGEEGACLSSLYTSLQKEDSPKLKMDDKMPKKPTYIDLDNVSQFNRFCNERCQMDSLATYKGTMLTSKKPIS